MTDLTIICPCYNEVDNIDELIERIINVDTIIKKKFNLTLDYLFIDNDSNDGTVEKLKSYAKKIKKLKIIVNARNFGHLKSPYYALLQSSSRASVLISSDLQDPPEFIENFVDKWLSGNKIVLAVKPASDESFFMFNIRKLFYNFIQKISETPLVSNATGAGLFDKEVIDILKKIDDPNPYFRGLLCELGFKIAEVPFKQPVRKKGITKNNFYTLFDLAMLGITNHSKVPLRIMTFIGFTIGLLSFFSAIYFLIIKLLFWDSYDLGTAPLLIGVFFIGALQLFFLGVVGEYIASINTRIRRMPLVIEKERINFE